MLFIWTNTILPIMSDEKAPDLGLMPQSHATQNMAPGL